MKAYRIVWEDEAKAREVEIFVDYTLEAGLVQVEDVRPSKVTLYNSETKQQVRTLPVHTPAGRALLTRAFLATRDEAVTLADEIQAQLDARDDLVAAAV
jgi:hypothetical protein